jgi:catechol 2,3-dioxygenase-like lactoylglutathione lyase family enzyme
MGAGKMASQSQKKYLTVVGAAFLGVASAGHAQTSETAGLPAIKIAVADFVRGGASIVIRVADMTAALNRLKAAGFAGFAGPRVRPGFTTLDIRDPDGNAIELIDQTPVPAK